MSSMARRQYDLLVDSICRFVWHSFRFLFQGAVADTHSPEPLAADYV